MAVLDSGYDGDHADLSDDLVGEQCYCYDLGAGCCHGGGTEQSVPAVPRTNKVLDENNGFCCSTAIVTLTAGGIIELKDGVSVSGELTLAINEARTINP